MRIEIPHLSELLALVRRAACSQVAMDPSQQPPLCCHPVAVVGGRRASRQEREERPQAPAIFDDPGAADIDGHCDRPRRAQPAQQLVFECDG
jgi:hypothetical protein